jgi:isopentenyl phosphate kinase
MEKRLMESKPVILKIGGSAITDKKNEEPMPRTDVISRAADEIRKANVKKLVIVHGAGSFGHPMAQEYMLREGFREEGQKIGFAVTHNMVTVLNGLIMDALLLDDFPAVSVTPSSCIVAEDGRIKIFDDSVVRMLLRLGFTPVLYGDVVMDEKIGFTVVSGDQLASVLAVKLGARQIIMGGDTDGVFDADPKAKGAKPYSRLTLEELKRIEGRLGGSDGTDVTGGMRGKITELIPAIQAGIPAVVMNATKATNIYRALVGERVEGTVIEKA